jgi:Flp pilus assembly protein TadD
VRPLEPDPEPAEDRLSGPEEAYELLQRGTALLAKRHAAQAAVVLVRAAALEPSKGSILEPLGRAFFMSAQLDRAIETFEMLLEIDPSNDYAHYALGRTLIRLGRRAEGRTHLKLAVALAPESRLYRGGLGRLGPADR